MDKNVMKIKFKTVLTIILISFLIIGTLLLVKEIKKNLIKENSVKIRYAYVYNIETADALNKISEDGEFIDILEITLEGNDLQKINNLLKRQSYKKVKNLKLIVLDVYEVNINNEIKLSICPGEEYAYYTKGNESFLIKISKEFVDEIHKIVQEEASKNIKEFSSEKITIISEDNKEITITDEENIKILSKGSKHINVNINEEELTNERISYVVDFNEGKKIYVYFASRAGYIIDENDQKHNVAFIEDYENIIEIMFENYISKIKN